MSTLGSLLTDLLSSLREAMTALREMAESLGLVSNVLANLIAAAVIGLLSYVAGKALRAWKTRRTQPSPSPRGGIREAWVDAAAERAYLGWLQAEVQETSTQFHASPIVPTPAHQRQAPGWRYAARLFRHDAGDYQRNPTLSDADLSLRSGFGKRRRIRDLARELRRFSKIVVLGDPGSGKSVCLRQLAYDLARLGLAERGQPSVLPVLLEMGAYDGRNGEDGKPEAVLEFIRRSLSGHLAVREAPVRHPLLYLSRHLESLLQQGRLVCIFDALDEMPQQDYAARFEALKLFMTTWETCGNRFVYSCRSLDYDPAFNVDEVLIEPFDRRRIRMFLDRHVPEVAALLYRRILDDRALLEMVGSPFLLQALAYINRPVGEPVSGVSALWVPATRAELTRTFLATLLQREAREKQAEALARIEGGVDTLERFLAELAFTVQESRAQGTSAPVESLERLWQRSPQWWELLTVARKARILGKRGVPADYRTDAGTPDSPPPLERLEFVHHRLQEFFAAEELLHRLEAGGAVEPYVEDIWWQETIVLATALGGGRSALLERLLAVRDDARDWLASAALAAGPVPQEPQTP